MTRKRVENREGSLGYPGFVKPVFTKDSKPVGKRKRSLGHGVYRGERRGDRTFKIVGLRFDYRYKRFTSIHPKANKLNWIRKEWSKEKRSDDTRAY
ncbi:hypothetical protein TNCV_4822801 [Trichonephila clavipes]|nr:hypothetical protein TNCV_4822801 [Trichonephila clavipes]